jgi:hypothetical protein
MSATMISLHIYDVLKFNTDYQMLLIIGGIRKKQIRKYSVVCENDFLIFLLFLSIFLI